MTQKIKQPPRTPISLRDLRVQVYHEPQVLFAERLGVSVATLQSWERDAKSPRDRVRWKVVEALGLDYDDIIWPQGKASALAA